MYKKAGRLLPARVALHSIPACVLMLALAGPTIGCGTNTATTENLRSSLQNYFDKAPLCEHISYSGFPEEIQLNPDGRPNSSDEAAIRDRALHNAGLLTERLREISVPERFVPNHRHLQRTLVYNIAPGHQELWRPSGEDDRNPRLCFARVHIRSVDHYDEPGDTFNLRIAQVDYTYELTNVASWAKRLDVQDALPELKQQVTAPVGQEQAQLTPTSHGWQPDPGTRIAGNRPETASF